ncbi:MAG: terminase small subunit [Rhizomicrobium sp.]
MSAKKPTNHAAAVVRRRTFAEAYIANGRNATQAAIAAGYSPKTARMQGSRLLTCDDVKVVINAVAARSQAISGLTADRTLLELARLAYFDPRKLFDDSGNLKAVADLDDDTAAAVAGLDVQDGRGEDGAQTKKLKLWDKNAALDKAMKYLGLFEKDNAQRGPDLALQVVLIGPP